MIYSEKITFLVVKTLSDIKSDENSFHQNCWKIVTGMQTKPVCLHVNASSDSFE